MYFEVHLFNPTSRYNECVGIGVFYFKDLKPEVGSNPGDAVVKDVNILLSYKGK